jgi:hypothetical protein
MLRLQFTCLTVHLIAILTVPEHLATLHMERCIDFRIADEHSLPIITGLDLLDRQGFTHRVPSSCSASKRRHCVLFI